MATIIWTGRANDNPVDTQNYAGGALPTDGDQLVLNNTTLKPMVFNTDTLPATPTLTADAIFSGTQATGTLTFSGVVTDGETVTIGSTVYRFKDTMVQAFDVQRGGAGAAQASMDNLIAAINGTGTVGTEYFAGTALHPDVTAVDGGGITMDVTARIGGTDGNAIDSTEGLANGSWGAATLTSGADDFTILLVYVGEDSLFGIEGSGLIADCTKIINKSPSAGIKYRLKTCVLTIIDSALDKSSNAFESVGATLTTLTAVKGRSVLDFATSITDLNISYRDDKFADAEVMNDSSSTSVNIYQVGGRLTASQDAGAFLHMDGGRAKFLSTATTGLRALYQVSGRVDYDIVSTVSQISVYGGTFNTVTTSNVLTIGLAAIFPDAHLLKSTTGDLVSIAILVDLLGEAVDG